MWLWLKHLSVCVRGHPHITIYSCVYFPCVSREQRHGPVPRAAQLRPAQPHAQLPDQEAGHGGDKQHALPAAHRREAGLGALLHPQAGQRGPPAPHGRAHHARGPGRLRGSGTDAIA